MRTSVAGCDLIASREGCVLQAYLDTVGIYTVGVGHTGRSSPPTVHPGMRITRAQADAFLTADLAPAEATVNEDVKVKLTQNQFDSLVSLVFNIGGLGFQGSTVLRKINKGLYDEAADGFLMWTKPAALKSRRESERAQFLRK